jgi:transposase-like protein
MTYWRFWISLRSTGAKICSINPLVRLNVAPIGAHGSAVIKRRTNVVGIFLNDAAIVRLVDCQLQEQQEEWQLELRHFFYEATMAKMPESEAMLRFFVSEPAIAMAPAIS